MIQPPVPDNEVIRLAALHSIGVLDTPADPGIDSVTRYLAGLWKAPITAVSLIDRNRQWFKSRVGLEAHETPRSMSFCAHLLTERSGALVIPDALADNRFADNPLVTGDPRIRFYAGSALRDEAGLILGALCVIDREPREPTAEQLHGLAELAIAVSGSLVLHRSVHQLDRLANSDPLTGVLNRKGLDRYLAGLTDEPVSLLLLDLDGFKTVNDSLGHAAGDGALREVARRLGEVVRAGDAVARLGGDEFAIVLANGTGVTESLLVADRVHQLLASPFRIGDVPVVLATSIGIASRPLHAMDTGGLFALADAALYAAKAAGRSMSRVARSAPPHVTAPVGGAALVSRLRAAA